ncbi:hypothetical protein WJX84_004908 [Apatococcus fuscideae]|uniref:GHMP kinase N-terminal domain-containing protein n=1 Tax=Apatococcus fuscideae TaxID=2026836 RepID=A0AAW1T9I4_9CHLO
MISHRCNARVGLLGNPSDGYYGKTLSFTLRDLHAEVILEPAEQMHIIPHQVHDGLEASSLTSLVNILQQQGFGGGVRLLQAICCRFLSYCKRAEIELPNKSCFSLRYDTNIPRASGLAGSSAIVCAALSCLLDFYEVRNRVPLNDRPGIILGAEEDLGIVAGLQDRVAQVYGGLVYMDFEKGHMQEHGRGRYIPMAAGLLPPLLVVVGNSPSDSGKVHSDVRQRWQQGDRAVHEGMAAIADLAERGRAALQQRDLEALATFMDQNFELRRKIFGDAVIGKANLRMVKLARFFGGAAKLSGSGGAVVTSATAVFAFTKALFQGWHVESGSTIPADADDKDWTISSP